MNTQNIENALNGLDLATLVNVYASVNGYDGSFPECVTYDLDELYYLFEPISLGMVQDLVKLGSCDYYYIDDIDGLMGHASREDYLATLQDNIVDLADYLGENAIACWLDTDGAVQIEVFGECPDNLPDSVKRALIIDVLADQGVYDLPDSQIDDLIDQF